MTSSKFRTVLTLLNDAEWAKWSNSEIARRCGVHHDMVGSLRPKSSLAVSASDKPAPRTFTTKHGTTSEMRTNNIGKRCMMTWLSSHLDPVGGSLRRSRFDNSGFAWHHSQMRPAEGFDVLVCRFA